ncbi:MULTISPECIES: hypothetical protein [unclassified Streptomyces]|uniref:hypothetical protein n=1 Tax=unclassified Streptomyces TaxID=2593676 RepID=UPI00225AA455|nr:MULTISPECIES: hypothetical protein [unclassified Streptomyces]MCX5060336.1 hypothetical protein [Streptomyces sp. NBC_00452]MCX5247818.1 hypothetical protein [Streptomyces sp. NBC_00201]MCX5286372.1 hypothetical protein [Streptomyces sp. NBC_00183]
METTTRPRSPQPTGTPRWVAQFYQPSSASWQVCAESPHRAPVQYALGEMAHTVRARGGDLAVSLWGPEDGAWQRYDVSTAAPADTAPQAPSVAPGEPSRLTERMNSRRQQVLLAGLSKAGVYDLAPDDLTAVQEIVDHLDETTVRRIAHWLAAAGGSR